MQTFETIPARLTGTDRTVLFRLFVCVLGASGDGSIVRDNYYYYTMQKIRLERLVGWADNGEGK